MCVTDLNDPLLTQTEINSALTQTKTNLVHANLEQFTSIERLKFLHSALGFPPISALRRAIAAGYLLSFPDLSEKTMSKVPTQDITVLGYINQKRKNVQSTKLKPEEDEWTLTLKSHLPTKTNDFFHKVLDLNSTFYTD